MSTCESSEDHAGQVQEGMEVERYLFHIPGSFDLSLKTLANHMANILVFMYSWMLRELYHKNLPDDFIDNMNRGLAYSEEFIKFYCIAVNAAFRKSNQKKFLLKNEIQYYIPIDLAKKIVDAMEEIHSLLNDALIASYLKLPAAPFSRKNIVLLKKMEIVSGHLNNVWTMIQSGLGSFQSEI